MINYLSFGFQSTFKTASTISIIITIVSSLVSIAIFGLIIFAIVKTIKGVKNGTIKLEDLKKNGVNGESNNFTVCEYCGANNNKDKTSCEKCGANLKHD